MKYKLWNRQDTINGVNASHFFKQLPFKDYDGDIILIYSENGKVSQVECKDILAKVYDIDKSLSLDEFMSQYFAKVTYTEISETNETNN